MTLKKKEKNKKQKGGQMANNKQWGDFKGITLKAYENRYYKGTGISWKI